MSTIQDFKGKPEEQKAEEPNDMSEQASLIDTSGVAKMPTRKQRKQ